MIDGLLSAFRQKQSNLLALFPWCEVDRGVMHTHEGFYVVGVEVALPNTTFLDNRGAILSTYHYLLRDLLPEPSRLRLVQEVTRAHLSKRSRPTGPG